MSNRTYTLIHSLLKGLPSAGWLEVRLFRGHLTPSATWRIERQLENHILYAVTGGRGRFHCSDGQVDVQAPSALLLAKGLDYVLRSDPRSPLSFYPIHFVKMDRSGKEVELSPDVGLWQMLDASFPTDIIPILRAMHTIWYNDAGNEGTASGLHMVLSRLAAPLNAMGPKPSDESLRIQRVREFIDLHPARRLSLSDLAGMAGMGRSSFCKHFKDMLGLSPIQYAIRQRCHHAAGLMRDEGFRVGEAAAATGYTDAFSFSKQFRDVMGYPPSTIRRGGETGKNGEGPGNSKQ